MNKRLSEALIVIQKIADDMGLTYEPISWEIVPEDAIIEIASSGLPIRFRHWSHGQSYEYQKISGDMGWSKIYELILNTTPSYAFLQESNTDVANIMIIAHCFGHSAHFKNNYLFKQVDKQMVYHAAERATRIDNYIDQYGLDKVEHYIDIALSLERHIDFHKGIYRELYPKPKKVTITKKKSEFGDLIWDGNDGQKETIILNKDFPPQREYDILWFLINYAKNLTAWQRDIFQIIREESFYFYPQHVLKITAEGFASYVHAEIMYKMEEKDLNPGEYLEFLKVHEKVVQPGNNPTNINPYFLGFTILNDIKEKWDIKFTNKESELDGWNKILEVTTNEDDISFLRNYLTQELCDKLEIFIYKNVEDINNEYIQIESRKVEDIIENMISKIVNYGVPSIYILKASHTGIELEQENLNTGELDSRHVGKVLGYLQEIWGGVIDLKSIDIDNHVIHYTYDEEGFSDHQEQG